MPYYLKIISLVGFFVLIAYPGIADEALVLDRTRPHLNGLFKANEVAWDQYEYPYLAVQTTRAFAIPAAQLKLRLFKHLEISEVKIPMGSRITEKELVLPPEFLGDKDQIIALKDCSVKKCNLKLNQEVEVKPLEKSKDKLKTYHQFLLKRTQDFLDKKSLLGYEERNDNRKSIEEMLSFLPFLKRYYPASLKFLLRELVSGDLVKTQPKAQYLRSEVIKIGAGNLQPIHRISYLYVFEEDGSDFVVEIILYSNHYFDSSLRIFEIFTLPPLPKKDQPRAALVMTDVMEVDELKKSGLIRSLFSGKMVTAVSLYQKNFMENFQ